MSEPSLEAAETDPGQPAGIPAVKPSLLSKFNVLLILLAVVMGECIAAFLCLPGALPAAPTGQAASTEEGDAEPPHEEEQETTEAKEGHAKGEGRETTAGEVEADLGEFTVSAFQPNSNSTLYIEFHLYATVGAGQHAAFNAALELNKHRIRDQIIVIMRSSELTDYTDAQLALIKRKILEKTNKILGKPYLRAVIFSDFSFIEQ